MNDISTNSILMTSALLHATFHSSNKKNISNANAQDESESASPTTETHHSQTSVTSINTSSSDGSGRSVSDSESKSESENVSALLRTPGGAVGTVEAAAAASAAAEPFHGTSRMRTMVSPDTASSIDTGNGVMEGDGGESVGAQGVTARTRTKEDFPSTFPTMIDQIVSSENSIDVTSPLGAPREVHFDGLPPLSLSDDPNANDVDNFFNVDNEDDDEYRLNSSFRRMTAAAAAESEVLHHQLKNALSDLSAEKAMRHRKEKNLVKLAKELKKRTVQADLNQGKLVRMATTINALQAAAGADQERFQAILLKTKDQTLRQDDTIDDLRNQLVASQLQVDQLVALQLQMQQQQQVKQEAELTAKQNRKAALTERRNRFVLGVSCIIFALLLVGGAFLASSASLFSVAALRNAACAPIYPGSKLLPPFSRQQNDATEPWIAPWWAPVGSKDMVYKLVCASTSRTNNRNHDGPLKLHWNGDKLMVTNKSNGKSLFQGRASAGAILTSDEIHLFNRKKGDIAETVISAPWAIQQW